MNERRPNRPRFSLWWNFSEQLWFNMQWLFEFVLMLVMIEKLWTIDVYMCVHGACMSVTHDSWMMNNVRWETNHNITSKSRTTSGTFTMNKIITKRKENETIQSNKTKKIGKSKFETHIRNQNGTKSQQSKSWQLDWTKQSQAQIRKEKHTQRNTTSAWIGFSSMFYC